MRVVINIILLVVLLLVPLDRFVVLVKHISLTPPDISLIEGWKIVDRSLGVKDDLVAFSDFCRSYVPPSATILFFLPYSYFKLHYNLPYLFSYIPYRIRYYLYPVKVWLFRKKYEKLVPFWSHVDLTSKQKLLRDFSFIIGFALKDKDFPGFKEYKRNKEWVILKKQ